MHYKAILKWAAVVWTPLSWAYDKFGHPIVSLWVEKAAERQGLGESPQPMIDLIASHVLPALGFLTGPFGWGLGIGILLFSVPDAVALSRRLSPSYRRRAIEQSNAIDALLTFSAAKAAPANEEAHRLMGRIVDSLTQGDDRDRIIGVMVDRKVQDPNRSIVASISNLQHGARNRTILTEDELQEKFGCYYRSYQELSSWILQGGQLCGLPFSVDAHYRLWRELDREFLLRLRELTADERFGLIAKTVRETGYGEAVRAKLDEVERAGPASKPEHEVLPGKLTFDVHSQKRLAARLKEYAKPNSSAEIRFASLKQMELAETVEAIFTAAGWQTNYWNIPEEARSQRYVQGIELAGHNRFLIPALASELSQAGLAGVRAKVEEPETPMSADGWASIENHVRVTIGHA